MSVTIFKMKTHSRTDLTDQFYVNDCVVHKCKPQVLDIVAGKRKEHHYVVTCGNDECSKIAMESPQVVVWIWNQFNPKTQTQEK